MARMATSENATLINTVLAILDNPDSNNEQLRATTRAVLEFVDILLKDNATVKTALSMAIDVIEDCDLTEEQIYKIIDIANLVT